MMTQGKQPCEPSLSTAAPAQPWPGLAKGLATPAPPRLMSGGHSRDRHRNGNRPMLPVWLPGRPNWLSVGSADECDSLYSSIKPRCAIFAPLP